MRLRRATTTSTKELLRSSWLIRTEASQPSLRTSDRLRLPRLLSLSSWFGSGGFRHRSKHLPIPAPRLDHNVQEAVQHFIPRLRAVRHFGRRIWIIRIVGRVIEMSYTLDYGSSREKLRLGQNVINLPVEVVTWH